MRNQLKDPGRIQHMLEMALLLEREKKAHSLDAVKKDSVLFFGISKMAEIIGEAAYKVTKEFKLEHPETPWRQIEGMRHILVHGYYAISPELLWDIIEHDIPALIPILRQYLQDFDDE